MYAKFDTTTTPRSHRRRWIAVAVLGTLAALAVAAAPDSRAQPTDFACEENTPEHPDPAPLVAAVAGVRDLAAPLVR